MNEAELEASIYEWLVSEKAFPKESIQLEAVIGGIGTERIYRADLSIVDPFRKEVVALIEVKKSREHKALRSAISQLLQYRRVLDKKHIPLYLFFPPLPSSGKGFEIVQVLENGDTKEIYQAEFPSYDSLIAGDSTAVQVSKKIAVRSAVDSFKITAWSLAAVVLLVLCLDILGFLQLTSKQLLLGAVASGLLLLPFAAKLKMLGIEFERHQPEGKKDEKP